MVVNRPSGLQRGKGNLLHLPWQQDGVGKDGREWGARTAGPRVGQAVRYIIINTPLIMKIPHQTARPAEPFGAA